MILNQGISFGLLMGVSVWWLVMIWFGLLIFFSREKRGRGGILLILIGGGVNILMRLVYGGVVDNLSLFDMLYNNLADYLIVIGLCWYGYTMFIRRRRDSRS